MKSFQKHLGILSLSAFLLGCASYPIENLSIDLPRRALISGLPHYPQTDDQCGPASLATVLAQRGIEVTPDQLKPGVYIPKKQGSLAIELKAQTRRLELLPYEIVPNMSSLLSEVAAGNAVLVMQNLGLNWAPKWHFSVVVGYDLDLEEIYLRSGLYEAEKVDLGLFDRTWARASRWAMLALRPSEVPVTATPHRFIAAVNGLEQIGMTEQANLGYLTATKAWPEDAVAHFGLANTEYRLGNYKQALDSYLMAIQLDPSVVEYWNNISYALTELGCSAEAIETASCAIQLDPDNANTADTYQEMLERDQGNAAPTCPESPLCPIEG